MKILFVLEHYHPYIGGVEKLFSELCQNLVSEGNQVRVITTRFRKDLPQREMINGVEIVRLPVANRYIFTFFGVFLGWKYSRGFDIIHTTSYNAALPASIIGLFRRRKTIITFHEVWGRLWFQLPGLSMIERLLFFTYEQFVLRLPFTQFVAVSEFTHQSLLAYKPARKVVRIYNGLDYSSIRTDEASNGEGFLFFGRLGVSKGLDILLGACEILARNNEYFQLTVVIPTVPATFYRRVMTQITTSIYSTNIIIKHHLTDSQLQDEIRNSACVIIPSYSEGFCFAAAEVTAMNKPIIHSGRGALPEVVSGEFIQLARLDSNLLAEAMRLAMLGKWEYKRFRRFPLSDTVAQYIDLYKEFV